MSDVAFSVLFAGFYAVVTVWQSWAWVLLLPCLPVGMVLRRRFDRGRTLLLGGGTALVIFAASAGVIGATLSAGPDFTAGVYPSYFLGLVAGLCWLLHTLLALLLIWGGCLLTEAVLRAARSSESSAHRTARRARPAQPSPSTGRRTGRATGGSRDPAEGPAASRRRRTQRRSAE
jgi:hypothetical protein